jgi:uncharacterized 2Fe-2S/4Fe-4S cluster protein (DUF4445 family)
VRTAEPRESPELPRLLAGQCALGLDIGTTTLEAVLVDAGGEELARTGLINPQRVLGADVVSRLEAAMNGQGQRLRTLLADGLTALVRNVLEMGGRERDSVACVAAAGNSAMTLLATGADPRSLALPPHRPAHKAGLWLESAALGLPLTAPLYLFPLVGGYVGGDLVALLYALEESPEPALVIDLGTNAEVALLLPDRLLATSAAAGPAFEGEGIGCGMRAQEGAVTGAFWEGDRLRLRVLGNVAPLGLCGGGLLGVVAAALEGGLLDCEGVIQPPEALLDNRARYSVERDDRRALLLYRDASRELLLTQDDVRAFQTAKGAVRAAAECLLAEAECVFSDLRQVLVSGAFGAALEPDALKEVAMLPGEVLDKLVFLPHGVLRGLCRFLRNPLRAAREVQELSGRALWRPLSGRPEFSRRFLAALDFS